MIHAEFQSIYDFRRGFMRLVLKKECLGILTLLSIFLFSASLQAEPQSLTKVVTVSKNKRTFVIKLSSNATTGYGWFLQKVDRRLIQPISSRYLPPQNKKMMGAPGVSQWVFRVSSQALNVPQVLSLSLIYIRPWQPDAIAKTLHIKVVSQ